MGSVWLCCLALLSCVLMQCVDQQEAAAGKSFTVAKTAGVGSSLKGFAIKVAMLAAALFAFVPTHAQARMSLATHQESGLMSPGPTSKMGPAEYLVASLQPSSTAAAAFEATTQEETWPGWERTTRKQLLQMKQAHAHDHHSPEKKFVDVLLHPITTMVETLKLMVTFLSMFPSSPQP